MKSNNKKLNCVKSLTYTMAKRVLLVLPSICDALRILVLFVQFKKHEKHPWRRVNLLKLTLFHGCLSRFLNCTNGTKTRNAPHLSPPFQKLCLNWPIIFWNLKWVYGPYYGVLCYRARFFWGKSPLRKWPNMVGNGPQNRVFGRF